MRIVAQCDGIAANGWQVALVATLTDAVN